MHINDFAKARSLVDERNRLLVQRDDCRFGVTIGGVYQNELMIDAVRPVIVAELDRRIAGIDAELGAIGLSID